MGRIRKVQIDNFRGIETLDWNPVEGINCLIGPGDSGKSTVLDAIEACLRPRRFVRYTDADFHRIDVAKPIRICVTIGDLEPSYLNLERYGLYLRAFLPATGTIEDEPKADAEDVLTVSLTVRDDLVPSWNIVSDRAEAEDRLRSWTSRDALRLAPTRLGDFASHHLGWREDSVLNRVSAQDPDLFSTLADAARQARRAFGSEVSRLEETLTVVEQTAASLGVPVGEKLTAMLDADSVSLTGGSLSLHDIAGVPLRALGTGSTRLLVAGIQAIACSNPSILLVDEVEHGLEPHRILRLLEVFGADASMVQVIMTTHSPIVLRELSGTQLFVTRPSEKGHTLLPVGSHDPLQGTIRLYPEAFLAPSIFLCEGASEIGFLRGLDHYRREHGKRSMTARGVCLVDYKGGDADIPFQRAIALRSLDYRVAILRDADTKADPTLVQTFTEAGGQVFSWRNQHALEDEIFASLSKPAVLQLIERAVQLHDRSLIDDHIRSASDGSTNLEAVTSDLRRDVCTGTTRHILGNAAKSKSKGWFKSVTAMEEVSREIVAPDIGSADPRFRKAIKSIFLWAQNASQ